MSAKMVLAAALVVSPFAAGAQQAAEVPSFARVFGDHAVVQRDRPITVWGQALPRRMIAVTLGSRSGRVRADAQGRWRLTLPAMAAGGPYALTASDGRAIARRDDIMVGDVYLCSGQSNMEFPAKLSTNAWSGFPDAANDKLRFLNIAHASEPAPLDDLKSPALWQVAKPDTVGEASATCYYMARSLQKSESVPVGFIHASWGGTTIQSWIGARSLGTAAKYREGVADVALLGTDPARAMAKEERRQEAWWDAHDPNAAAQRAWIAPGFDDGDWGQIAPAGSWKQASIPALSSFDGVVWYRTRVNLTEAQAAAANMLELGPIDTFDAAWVNGTRVGGGSIAWVWRNYPVRRGLLRAGVNVIVLRVLGGGGLTGPIASRGVRTGDGTLIPLPATWRYRTGMRSTGLSVPDAPWNVPTSLTTLYNGMIAPLRGYGFKLAAWYQGEANVGAASEYRDLLPMLFADWRRELNTPELPFLVAQLSSIDRPVAAPARSAWAELREAQAEAVTADQRAALAVTIDVGDRYDIHPTQKTIVGERLARAARSIVYGHATTAGGPEATTVERAGSDLIVRFRHANGGLKAYSGNVAIGFEACQRDKCYYVPGTLHGDAAVLLPAANRADVTHVRYAWADAPYVNLYSTDDLPAVPFELPVPAR